MGEEPRVYGALAGEQVVFSTDQLALFLGGSGDSFTGQLLYLIAKGAHSTYSRFACGFPVQVRAYQVWMAARSTPNAAELAAAIEADKQARAGGLIGVVPASAWN